MSRKKKKSKFIDYISPEFSLDEQAKHSIIVVILLLLSLISLLSLFNLAGHFGVFTAKYLSLAFGFGKWLFPLLFLYGALILIRQNKQNLYFNNYLGLFFLFISYQTLFHFFFSVSDWQTNAMTGIGGGYIGWQFSRLFLYIFGFWGGAAVLVALFLISLVLLFNSSLSYLFGQESVFVKVFLVFTNFFHNLFSFSINEDQTENKGQKYVAEARERVLSAWRERDVPTHLEIQEEEISEEEEEEDEGDEREMPNIAALKKDKKKTQQKIVWPKRSIKLDIPLDILDNNSSKAVGDNIDINASKIKRTLSKFGIEVEMGSTKTGPTVTQYTFRPAEGIKLSRITTLNNDLSLALAANPIRIEAPIPGKSLVGIEVPNRAKAIVGLREILESKSFKKRKNNFYIALGKDVAGNSWLYDLTKMPHLLVAGATNSGKSVCLNSIIVSLLYQNNPEDLRFIMVDPKRVELPIYNGIPHLLTPVITNVNKTINALKWCLNEMERRYDVLNNAKKRNIQSYNISTKDKLPYIVFIIDELADFMMTAGKDMEAAIIRLAQMSRAVGIHLILATQRPSVDVITGLIKANVPTRIAFSVASLVDSKTILDSSGAEKLLGQGDMLFSCAEFAKPKRIQGAYLSDNEINDVVNYIKDKSGPAEYLEGITDRQKVSGNAGVGLDGNRGDEDELFSEAKELIVKAKKASTSMLQRRLSIGYGRAAKILDMLEEEGIIGPSNGSKPREVFLSPEQYEGLESNSLSTSPLHQPSKAQAPDSYLTNDQEDSALVFKNEEVEEDDDDENNGSEENNEDTDEETSERGTLEKEEKIEEELSLSEDEEEDKILDEDEIIEEIVVKKDKTDKQKVDQKNKKDQEKKEVKPWEDDEMFFAK